MPLPQTASRKDTMKKALRIVLLVLVRSPVAYVYRRPVVLRLVGVRPFVEERFEWWLAAGATEEELDAALLRTQDPLGSGPGSWVHEISTPPAERQR